MISDVQHLCGELKAVSGLACSDAIDVGLLLVAVLALWWNARSAGRQAKAADFSSYLQLTARFSTAWRRYLDASVCAEKTPNDIDKAHRRRFEFTEVLNLLEGACHLYTTGNLQGATRAMICDYLKETIPLVHNNEYGISIIRASYSGPDTFLYIRKFARKHNIEGVLYQ